MDRLAQAIDASEQPARLLGTVLQEYPVGVATYLFSWPSMHAIADPGAQNLQNQYAQNQRLQNQRMEECIN